MGFFKCHIACALAFLVAMSYVLQAQDMQKDKQEAQDFTEQKYQANQNGYTDNFDVFIQFVWVRHLLDTGYQSASNPWEDAIISAKKSSINLSAHSPANLLDFLSSDSSLDSPMDLMDLLANSQAYTITPT